MSFQITPGFQTSTQNTEQEFQETTEQLQEAIQNIIVGLVPVIQDLIPDSKDNNYGHKIDQFVEQNSQITTENLTYKLDSEYNYYTDFYEEITKNNINVLEPALPNLYVYADELNKDNEKYKNIITVNDKIKITPSRTAKSFEYFDEYAKQYQRSINLAQNNPTNLSDFTNLANTLDNIYYSRDGIKRFSEINSSVNLMPFATKLEFKNHTADKLCFALENSEFVDIFCTNMVEYSKKYFTQINLNIISSTTGGAQQETLLGKIFGSEAQNGQNLNPDIYINEFLQTARNLVNNTTNENTVNILGDVEQENQLLIQNTSQNINNYLTNSQVKKTSNSLYRAIRTNIFFERLKLIFKSLKLKPLDFLRRNQYYTEVFMYEINKLSQDGTIIQTFYVPNTNDVNIISLFDSQVKFDKNYTYSINAFCFSLIQKINANFFENLLNLNADIKTYLLNLIVNKFGGLDKIAEIARDLSSYNEQQKINLLDSMINIIIENGKYVLDPFVYYPALFKKNVMNEQIFIFDHPPPPPEVNIDGFIGIDNKILFTINGSISEFKSVPVIIQPEDTLIFNKNIVNQKLSSLEDKILFDGDDRPEYFQLFKLDFHPKSYLDFKNNFVTISTTFRNSKQQEQETCALDIVKAYHSSYVDNIIPNKKYYYMLRTVDIHGNISNPSSIYEVELVNQDGTIYPIIKTVELLTQDNKEAKKNVRRFLHIVPNALQTIIDEEQSEYFSENGEIKQSADLIKDKVVLGLTEQKVWNKNYRLKVKSKITGKIVELDFKFTYKTQPNSAICE